jgi:hypothetical protein
MTMPEDPDKQTPPHEGPPMPKSAGEEQDLQNPVEHDLWDLDDSELEAPDLTAPVHKEPMNLTVKGVSINPRDFEHETLEEGEDEELDSGFTQGKTSQPRKTPGRTGVVNLRPRPIDTFDDLDEVSEAPIPPEEKPKAVKPATPAPQPQKSAEIEPPLEELEPSSEPADDTELPAFEEVDEAEKAAAAAEGTEKKLKIPLNKKDLIGLGIFVAVALVVLIGILVASFSILRFKKDPDLKVRVPIVGQFLTISQAEPYWREPKRTGTGADLAKREAILIPAIQIHLSEKSGSGALRILFRSSEGETIGDPVIKTFSNGRFSTGDTAEFAGTDGFTELSQFPAYRNEKDQIWKAEVFEATSADADAQHFKKIAEIPLLPYLK